jgi:hypothetical protein
MVTHRKALLELMDTIYVLENRTLTNVNELGGLDSYLAKLEGLVIQDNTNQNPTIGTDSADLTENLTSANNMNISDDYVDPLNNQSKIDTEYEQQNLTIDHPPTETNDMTIKIDHKDND